MNLFVCFFEVYSNKAICIWGKHAVRPRYYVEAPIRARTDRICTPFA